MKYRVHPGVLGLVSGWTQKSLYALEAVNSAVGPSERELMAIERFAQLVERAAASAFEDTPSVAQSAYSTVPRATRQVLLVLGRRDRPRAIAQAAQAADAQLRLVRAVRARQSARCEQRDLHEALRFCNDFASAIAEIDRTTVVHYDSHGHLAYG